MKRVTNFFCTFLTWTAEQGTAGCMSCCRQQLRIWAGPIALLRTTAIPSILCLFLSQLLESQVLLRQLKREKTSLSRIKQVLFRCWPVYLVIRVECKEDWDNVKICGEEGAMFVVPRYYSDIQLEVLSKTTKFLLGTWSRSRYLNGLYPAYKSIWEQVGKPAGFIPPSQPCFAHT